jgi:molybdopterin molybdotransferase
MAPLAVEEALARVLAGVTPTEIERVPLMAARGRVLAEVLAAGHDQPPFDASSMDGYAVRAADVAALPASLAVVGEAAAGRGFAGGVNTGQAVRIFTGAPLPAGADLVVIQENTRRDGVQVVVEATSADGPFIRRRGFDFARGATLLTPPRRLTARDVALAAAMGHAALPVRRRPVVAILATGDELVLPGRAVGPDQIVCSNPFGVAAMVEDAGGEARFLGIARDDRADLARRFAEADGADVLVTIGGASKGDHDLVAPVLESRGVRLDFWNIAMRPGKPMMFALDGRRRVLGLPGNPVSALICTRVFLVPLLRSLVGLDAGPEKPEPALAAVAMEANGPRQHYARGLIERGADGSERVRPVRSQDSSLLSPLAAADCLIVRPSHAAEVPAGGPVGILRLDF